MTSPLSGATLTAQRANNRWKNYYLAISHPNIVFTARINQTFTTFDGITRLNYDGGGNGTYTDVLAGMTCWVGSAAGLFDIGIVRVRSALATATVDIGKVSGIQFANDQYLTFVDDFQIWPREPRISGDNIKIDEDILFDAADSFAPLVNIGPPALVLDTTAASVSVEWTAPTIYSPTSATAASYVWTAPGSSSTADLTTSTPVFAYSITAASEHYITCSLTDSAGAVSTVYRRLFINPAAVPAYVSNLQGDIDAGGWSCDVEGYSSVDTAALHDRAMVVLWKRDYVGTAADTAVGPYPDAENIRLVGWIDGESITRGADFGTFNFTVYGPAYWLDKIPGSPATLNDTTSAAAAWDEIAGMTTDKAVYHLVKWRSTLNTVTDFHVSGDTTRIKLANINTGSLRQQIAGLLDEKLMARLAFDRFGCGWSMIHPSLLSAALKGSAEVLWDTSKTDWIEQIEIERSTSAQTAQTEIGGFGWDGTTETEVWSRAPGNMPNQYGAISATYSNLALDSQAIANRISGDVLALDNAEYPTVDIVLDWPNDFVDLAPHYIITANVVAADTPRGIVWTAKRLFAEAVGYEFNYETGAETTLITLAEETTGDTGVTFVPPEPGGGTISPPPAPTFPGIPGIGTIFPPIVPPPPPGTGCGASAPANSFPIVFDETALLDGETSTAYFPCILRPAAYTNGPSTLQVMVDYEDVAGNNIECYGVGPGGDRIITGVVTAPDIGDHWTPTLVTFSPIAETEVAGFQIEANCFNRRVYQALTLTSSSVSYTLDGGGTAEFTVFTAEQLEDHLIKIYFETTATENNLILGNYMDITLGLSGTPGGQVFNIVDVYGGTGGSDNYYKDYSFGVSPYAPLDYHRDDTTYSYTLDTNGLRNPGYSIATGFQGTFTTSGTVYIYGGLGDAFPSTIRIKNPGVVYNVCPPS